MILNHGVFPEVHACSRCCLHIPGSIGAVKEIFIPPTHPGGDAGAMLQSLAPLLVAMCLYVALLSIVWKTVPTPLPSSEEKEKCVSQVLSGLYGNQYWIDWSLSQNTFVFE